jgi:hypothetical protein
MNDQQLETSCGEAVGRDQTPPDGFARIEFTRDL